MKVALIPPVPDLAQFESSGYNMLLAPLLKYPAYQKHYMVRHMLGDFSILDNGAHEGELDYSLADLLNMSKGLAGEIVLPDVPHDSQATFEKFREALVWLNTDEGISVYRACGEPRLMFVPQVPRSPGHFVDYIGLAFHMISMCFLDTWIPAEKFTIGIALMYDDLDGGLLEIVDRVAAHLEDDGPAIHLLGWSRNIDTPIRIAQRYPSAVRSIDTAKPFVYAREGVLLERTLDNPFLPASYAKSLLADQCQVPPYPGRQDDYFTKPLTSTEAYIGNFNSNILKALVFTGRVPSMSESGDSVPAESWQKAYRGRPGLPDGIGSEEGDAA